MKRICSPEDPFTGTNDPGEPRQTCGYSYNDAEQSTRCPHDELPPPFEPLPMPKPGPDTGLT